MREYKSDAIYSFRCPSRLKPEILMKRVYEKNDKRVTEKFYAERTSNPDILIIPSSYVYNTRDNTGHGFSGEIKDGLYFMGKVRVILHNAHQVYNGEAYVYVKEYKEGEGV